MVRAIVLVMLLAGVVAPHSIAAQADSAAGLVDYTDPYTLRSGDIIVPSAVLEMLLANDGDLVLIALGTFDDPGQIRLDALARLDAEADGLVVVDSGTSGDSQYWLDLVAIDGVSYGVFTLSRSGDRGVTITMFLGPVTTFAAGMAVAQQSVMVAGEPVFSGVGPDGLQSLLESALPNLETGGDQEEDRGEPADDDTGDREDASADEFADMPGMIAEGVYVSPHYNVVLTWTSDWDFSDIVDAPVVSDLNADVDQVFLRTTGSTPVLFSMIVGPAGDGNFSDVFEATTSQATIQALTDPSARVLDRRLMVNQDGTTVGAVIVSVDIEGFELVLYQELRLSDDQQSITLLQFMFDEEQIMSSLRMTRSIEFEGGRSVTAYTRTEIIGIVDRKNPTL